MNVHAIAVAGIVLSHVVCGACSDGEESNTRDSKSGTEESQLQNNKSQLQNNELPHEIELPPSGPLRYGKPNRRRYRIESLSPHHQVLLAIPRDDISLTNTRADGLLERSLSLDVEQVFVGKDAGPVITAYEIVAPLQIVETDGNEPVELPRQDFISRDGKARLVTLARCVEEDGRVRRVVAHAFIPSPAEIAEFAEDASTYTPKSTKPRPPCKLGTAPLVDRMTQVLHIDL